MVAWFDGCRYLVSIAGCFLLFLVPPLKAEEPWPSIAELIVHESPNVKKVSPPVTEEEILAAIRFSAEAHSDTPGHNDALQTILANRAVPDGSRLEVDRVRDPGGNTIYECEDVNLFIRVGPRTTFNVPIRSRLTKSMSLSEAIASINDFLTTPASHMPGRRRAIARLEALEARLTEQAK